MNVRSIISRFKHWLGWKLWWTALRFRHIEQYNIQNALSAKKVGERVGYIQAMTDVADALNLQWPVAPTVEMYRTLKRLWISNSSAICYPFPICIVEDDELSGRLVFDPDLNKQESRWMLAATWIEEAKLGNKNG